MKIKFDKITLSIIQTIDAVILHEIAALVYPSAESRSKVFPQSSAYIKFLPIISSIEFLGACYDELPFDTTRLENEDIVERRFNKALKELFRKEYGAFAKADNDFYFYKKLRCAMIHQLRPGKGIMLTTRKESIEDGTSHLEVRDTEYLILVLEDLYDDLEKAAKRLVTLFEKRKLTNKKGQQAFLQIINYESSRSKL